MYKWDDASSAWSTVLIQLVEGALLGGDNDEQHHLGLSMKSTTTNILYTCLFTHQYFVCKEKILHTLITSYPLPLEVIFAPRGQFCSRWGSWAKGGRTANPSSPMTRVCASDKKPRELGLVWGGGVVCVKPPGCWCTMLPVPPPSASCSHCSCWELWCCTSATARSTWPPWCSPWPWAGPTCSITPVASSRWASMLSWSRRLVLVPVGFSAEPL